jgi:ABC-type transport system involved in multi-copper enzyme maturation permease subunit
MPTAIQLPFEISAPAVVLMALGLVALLWPIRLALRWLLGPLFSLEMTRLARRGGIIWGRCAYALALLVVLYNSFPRYDAADWRVVERFAEHFAEQFLTVQTVIVLLFLPLYFGGAISDEKERGSLDFLLGSRLTAREIVIGKYAARVFNLNAIVMAGLPILALTAFWGGVSVVQVALLFAATALSVFSLGAVAVVCSVLCRRTVTAIAWSYVLTLVINFFTSPLTFLTSGGSTPFPLAQFAGIHIAIASIALLAASVKLRRSARPPTTTIEYFPRPIAPPANELQLPSMPVVAPLTSWRPIGRDPLLWKERHVGRANEPLFEVLWLYFAGILATVSVFAFLSDVDAIRVYVQGACTALLAFMTIGLCLGLLIDLGGAISREREQRTLESLVSLPIPRGRILRVKLRGALYRRGRWIIAIVLLLSVSVISGTLPALAVALLAFLILGQAMFVASLSLLASLESRSTVRAYVAALVTIAGLIVVTTASRGFIHGSLSEATLRSPLMDGLSPVRAWLLATQQPLDAARRETAALAAGMSAAAYLTAALLLDAVTHWRFRRSERYT